MIQVHRAKHYDKNGVTRQTKKKIAKFSIMKYISKKCDINY